MNLEIFATSQSVF